MKIYIVQDINRGNCTTVNLTTVRNFLNELSEKYGEEYLDNQNNTNIRIIETTD